MLVCFRQLNGFYRCLIHSIVRSIVWLAGPIGYTIIVFLDNVQSPIRRTTIPNDIAHPGILLVQYGTDCLLDYIGIIMANRNDGDMWKFGHLSIEFRTKIASRIGVITSTQVSWRSLEDKVTAICSSFRSQVDYVICTFDHIQIMFDDNQGMAMLQ